LAHKRWIPTIVMLVMTVITIVTPSLLDIVPSQPEFRPMPIETKSVSTPTLPYGQYNFGNYIVVNSSTITSGSHVQGNVTFYWMVGGGWMQPLSHVGILKESDYIRQGPEDLAKLTKHLANFTDIGSCCADPTYGRGYGVGFNFISEETTRYYFLFDTGEVSKITVVIFPSERVTPLWKMSWVWGLLTAVVTVIGYFYPRKRRGV